jgi:hypothetical protein
MEAVVLATNHQMRSCNAVRTGKAKLSFSHFNYPQPRCKTAEAKCCSTVNRSLGFDKSMRIEEMQIMGVFYTPDLSEQSSYGYS